MRPPHRQVSRIREFGGWRIGASTPLKTPECGLTREEGYVLASLNRRVCLSDWPVPDIFVREVDRRTATVALINDQHVVNALRERWRTVNDAQHRIENRAFVLSQRPREVGHRSIINRTLAAPTARHDARDQGRARGGQLCLKPPPRSDD